MIRLSHTHIPPSQRKDETASDSRPSRVVPVLLCLMFCAVMFLAIVTLAKAHHKEGHSGGGASSSADTSSSGSSEKDKDKEKDKGGDEASGGTSADRKKKQKATQGKEAKREGKALREDELQDILSAPDIRELLRHPASVTDDASLFSDAPSFLVTANG